MNMKNRRSRMTDTMLKDAFYELLEEMPVNRITVKMLCEKADLNRSTFYLRYTTLEEFLVEIEREWVDEHLRNIGTVGENDITIPYITHALEVMHDNAKRYRRMLENPKIKARFIQVMLDSYPDIICGGGCAEEYVHYYVLSGAIAVVERWLDSGCSMPPSQLAEILYKLDHDTTLFLDEVDKLLDAARATR